MFINMDKRQQELKKLKEYIENIDKETTLLLQNLQWDHKHLIKSTAMVSCKYVACHRIPVNTRETHEKQCYLALNGYSKKEVLLPDLINPEANTIVKLSKQDIMHIINMASSSNPSFKRGVACPGPEPLSLERLQLAYTADERRAIYDAVVSAAPACHDLTDLALVSSSSDRAQSSKVKSRVEILAELRDMKRRRTKYRVAAKTRNYSDVLRDVIRTQMELYAEAKGVCIKTEYGPNSYISLNKPPEITNDNYDKVPQHVIVNQDKISPEADSYSESSRRYRKRSRSKDRHYDKHRRKHDDGRSEKRSDFDNDVNSSDRRYRELSQNKDKYNTKERNRHDNSHTKQDKYNYKSKEVDSAKGRSTNNDYRKSREFNDSKDSYRYKEDRNKHSKYNRHYENGSSKHSDKYESSSKNYDKYERNNKDDCYKRKHEEYEKSSRGIDSYKERNHKPY